MDQVQPQIAIPAQEPRWERRYQAASAPAILQLKAPALWKEKKKKHYDDGLRATGSSCQCLTTERYGKIWLRFLDTQNLQQMREIYGSTERVAVMEFYIPNNGLWSGTFLLP
jgi:hypothetical protein